MKRIIFLLLALMLFAPPALSISYDAEKRLDQYIDTFDLTQACKTVIVNYLPGVDTFDGMEREGTNAFSLYLEDGTKFYLIVSDYGEPVSLMSSEEDYSSRTKHYDKSKMKIAPYVGNKNSKKLHQDWCASVADMKEKNKVEFTSKEDALDEGYTPCRQCRP